MAGGRRSGIFTALGVAGGQATWTPATSAGISALLLASEPAFAAVKLLGAAYLVVLGAQAMTGAVLVALGVRLASTADRMNTNHRLDRQV